MSLQDLAPANSQRAQQTAINAFSRFLVVEDVNIQCIAAAFLGNMTGAKSLKLMDHFAIYLTSAEDRGGKALARRSVISYYRHVKNWLLDIYPKNRASIKKKLLNMARPLERHCLKRLEGGTTKRTPAYTKEDLRILTDGLYVDATSPLDYHDAALLALMWYAFGRASDLGFIAKSNLTVVCMAPRHCDICENRQNKSAYKQIVNYMKLFLPDGFKLDPSSSTHCGHVLEVGQHLEDNMFIFS